MKLPGDQVDRDINDRKTDRAAPQRLDHAFLDCGDIITRDRAADDSVDIGETRAARQRFHLERDVGELAMAPTLTLEAGMLLSAAPDRLLVVHRSAASIDRQVVAIAQAVDGDLQMNVALAPQHHFLRVGVLLELERGILLDQLTDRAG